MDTDLEMTIARLDRALGRLAGRQGAFSQGEGIMSLQGFGLRLRLLRKERGLSYFRLAQRTGLARSHLLALERGKVRVPTVVTAMKLARGLDLSLDELLCYHPQVRVRCSHCGGEGWLLQDEAA